MERVTLRSAEPTESEFCYALHEQTMREYVEAMFGTWDETLQRRMHEFWFDPDRVRVIELNGEAVGVLDADCRPGHIYVSRIEVLPQGLGIGSGVLNELISRGPVQLHVFNVNPRARALYERLGFVASSNDEVRVLMEHPGAQNGERHEP
jgi:ribosomal protein S18 acetylase RimI-like enzyme